MEILFASQDRGKIGQFQFAADRLGYPAKIVSVYDKFPEVKPYSEEHGSSEEIVKHGAREIFEKIKSPVVVENNSLEVEALGKGPGPKSGKYLKEKKLAGLIEEMKGKISRKARLVSTVGFYDGSKLRVMKNAVEGQISDRISFKDNEPIWVGPFGGGFNAVFIHPKKRKTFGEMTAEEFFTHGYSEPNFKLVLKHIFGY